MITIFRTRFYLFGDANLGTFYQSGSCVGSSFHHLHTCSSPLARSRAKALRELKLSRQERNTMHMNEEINLPPLAIDTSQNISYDHVAGR